MYQKMEVKSSHCAGIWHDKGPVSIHLEAFFTPPLIKNLRNLTTMMKQKMRKIKMSTVKLGWERIQRDQEEFASYDDDNDDEEQEEDNENDENSTGSRKL